MTEAQALEAISARWADPTTGWPSLQPGIQWTFENLKFDAADRWARVTVDCTSGGKRRSGPLRTDESSDAGESSCRCSGLEAKGERASPHSLSRFARCSKRSRSLTRAAANR
jgi:hypothetical protein